MQLWLRCLSTTHKSLLEQDYVDEIIFILNSGLLTATATLAINSALDETEKFEQWEFLEEMIQEYSMLFYDTDILA